MSSENPPISSAAVRQRRRRERRAKGRIVVQVEIDHVDTAEALKAIGLLAERDEDNPKAIGDALGRAMVKVIGHA